MKNFLIAYNLTLGDEGGYSNDTDDRGGETYKGISRNNWPKWEGWNLIDVFKRKFPLSQINKEMSENSILQNMVLNFYLQNYWIPMSLAAFPELIASELFDTAVNQGKTTTIKYLQKALNKLNRNQEDYQDLIEDGKIGQNTIKAFKSYMATERFASRNTAKLIKWLLKWLNYYQLQKYDQITYKDPAQEIFIPGWTERA